MKIIDISGIWTCTSPDGSINTTVKLPGSSCESKIGRKAEYFNEYTKESVRAPLEKYEYIGELIYERDIEIPADWEGLSVSFFFERINIASKLWIDDIQIGRGVIELSTPHVYKITDRHDSKGKVPFDSLVGKHHIKLLIDNRNLLNMGDMASGYSIDTQGYWNGCIGRMEIIGKPVNHIERLEVFTNSNGFRLKTVICTDRHIPMDVKKGKLNITVKGPDGEDCPISVSKKDIELFASRQTDYTDVVMTGSDIKLWNEFDRNLYTVCVELESERCKDMCHDTFGFRDISVSGKRFILNGDTLSLRGTINCAQYPLTGYPPMDIDTWTKHFEAFKEHGLNHVRFHAWCPPEAAFVAADNLGIYLSVEMPLWLNRDISEMEFGDDEWHEMYYRTEALRISQYFGNHPSFCFFSNGNENMGDFAMLETIIAETKAVDNRRVYTMTSNFDHPKSPYEDYLCAFEILHNVARIQFLHDEVAKSTSINYDGMAETVPVPFTSFEVGQYCVYPNVDLIEKYNGNMLPTNLDIIKKMMIEHGVYEKLNDYILASGDLAAKLYKEDIEAVLRTKGMGGFQLLSLVDYTGQSTATVGILDIFHESKNVIEPKEWRHFCSEVVPLFESKRVFLNTEDLKARISLYDHGREKIEKPVYILELESDGRVLTHNELRGSNDTEDHPVYISIPLNFIKKNSLVKVTVSVNGYKNSWRIFVYEDSKAEEEESCIVRTPDELGKAINEGKNVIALRTAFADEQNYKNSFVPVFWSPVHFPSTDPCGAFINESHEALNMFPTGKYIDYQWKELLDNSVSFDISKKQDADVIMEMVPNYVDNIPKSPLFILKEGKSNVLVCGFDLDRNDITTKVLRSSLIKYIMNK